MANNELKADAPHRLARALGGQVDHPRTARALSVILICLSALLGSMSTGVEAQEVITGPGFRPHQEDPTHQLEFRPPPGHVDATELAMKNGLFRAYQLPAPDGRSRSFFTVAFQAKSDVPGLRTLSEFVNVDLHTFKSKFPNSVIAQVNIQGRIPAKLGGLGFPLEMFMFKGNEQPGSNQGDGLVLFFATPGGFWSVVWTVPQQFIQQGLSVFFEPFIEDMTVTPKGSVK